MASVIYLMTNVAMPGLVKIGKTDSADTLNARLRDLYNTSVPLPFEWYFAAQVDDADTLERKLHSLFGEFRVNTKRAFFRVDPEKVVIAVTIGSYQEINVFSQAGDADEQRVTCHLEESYWVRSCLLMLTNSQQAFLHIVGSLNSDDP
ncbi:MULTISPECIES: GIY-YIG nuclease family protein [Acidithiobacillus]|nr:MULTISPECIES: GIY-YIG nuclease family protein [Acidithiobacillus]ACH84615.1 hypothetical protein Lferr_2419 [Acidithiobacillus ferrooxidans ATCC 53993]MBN6744616.1 GIY-YIG nuclease family protein [Acidithiobacillus sp. MC2.2]MBN6747494.1 GIY-YIG nuclease family protein [Acidithiobacillus sp. PG05]MBU2773806.1 GIY-YIG nuclease family protein [Acidithiobacillus ferrooxidans]MBU2816732.1 GIY-YIG nuclease family protein [Acidithiobacillus ferrooxidans]